MDRKEVLAVLQAAAPTINKTAVDKGFWKEGADRNKGEMVMLMVSELGEALEAHRKRRVYDYRNLERTNFLDQTIDLSVVSSSGVALWIRTFEDHCKDTVGDEIADALIRIMDYIYGWKITWHDRDLRKESTRNFGHDLLRIIHYMMESYHNDMGEYGSKDWGYTLKAIVAFCDWWKIDILLHLKWKIKYNATREHLHGKDY